MRSATDTLRDIAGGELVEDLGEVIRELNTAISLVDNGKGGSITVKINIKPAGRQSGAMRVGYDIKLSKPSQPRRESIMFGTPEGDLLATDPTQRQLDLRDINATSPTTVRDLGTTTQTTVKQVA
ncbi:hypothetical protein HQN60_12515 [Deefgea piscis]|uniref:Uncharacterized protein n=1 Tax=Deefgea piscis TaxID=2739061 RepID=A0A6M8SS07_9NEIS|nr:hypothetical protein [Deefgea piscis]QKJ67461.1 hypothetical protein HQN60_12515 [Deefgea piscis]